MKLSAKMYMQYTYIWLQSPTELCEWFVLYIEWELLHLEWIVCKLQCIVD